MLNFDKKTISLDTTEKPKLLNIFYKKVHNDIPIPFTWPSAYQNWYIDIPIFAELMVKNKTSKKKLWEKSFQVELKN